MPTLTAVALVVLVIAIVVLAIREAFRLPLFPLVVALFLTVPVLLRHDGSPWLGLLGLLSSAGGWIILLGSLWASHVIAEALHALIRFVNRHDNSRSA